MIGSKTIGRLGFLTGLVGLAVAAHAGPELTTPSKDLSFIENLGQWDSRALYYSGLPGMDVWITSDGLVYKVYQDAVPTAKDGKWTNTKRVRSSHAFGMEFVGANANPIPNGVNARKGIYNYIHGNKRVSGVQRYEEARLDHLYDGIDMRVYHDEGGARFDLVVQPGADPSVIGTHFTGTENVRVISPKKLGVQTRFGETEISGLFVYQEVGGKKKEIKSSFYKQNGVVKFKLGSYDHSRALVIDPLVYSTLLGAVGDDQGMDIAANNLGYAFMCGVTWAPTFPTSFGAFNEFIQDIDGYVTKFTTDAVEIVWSTFIGGAAQDSCNAIAIDAFDNAYVTGHTNSQDFPTTLTSPQPANGGSDYVPDFYYPGGTDAFILKLSADGTSMIYGTYVGGKERGKFDPLPSPRPDPPPFLDVLNPACSEVAVDIVVDSAGAATICGFTRAPSFPVTANAVQPTFAGPNGVPDLADWGKDGFITKINPAGTAWVFSTFMGGRAIDVCSGLSLDADDNIYIAGATNSTGLPTTPGVFPTTPGAFDRSIVGRDMFLIKMPPAGNTRVWATVLGGNGNDGNFYEGDDGVDIGWTDFHKPNIFNPLAGFFRYGGTSHGNPDYGFTRVSVDPQGDAYITGTTRSTNYPTTIGAFDRQFNNGIDCGLTRVFRDGTRLIYSTLIGSNGQNWPNAIRVDDTGVAYVAGYSQTGGLTMPAAPNTVQPAYQGPDFPNDWFDGDAFVLAFNDSGSNILWGSYVGGDEGEEAFGVDLDPSRSFYLAGRTNSWVGAGQFPTTAGAFRTFMINDRPAPNVPPKAWSDAFLAKLHIRVPIVMDSLVMVPKDVAGTQQSVGTITLSGPASAGGAVIHLVSNQSDIVQIPSEITIPEGQTVGTFTADTAAVIETYTTTVTATFEARTLQAPLVVAPYLSALTVSTINVVGGNNITGRVTLFQPAPTGGAEVFLYSGDPNVVQMPVSVMVPEGQTTAIFDISTNGVTVFTPVQLTAQFLGMARTQVVNVLPSQLVQFFFTPNRVSGGEKSTARVSVNGEVGADTTLTISYVSGYNNVSFPNTVVIPAGASFVEFDVQTGFVPANGITRLRATGPMGSIDGSLGIDHTQISSIFVDSTDVIGGALINGRVNLTRPAAASGLRITLSNNNPVAGTLSTTNLFVPPGSTTSEPFTIQTNSVSQTQNMTITASKPGYTSKSVTILVREPTLGLQLLISPSSVVGGLSTTGILSISGPHPDDLTFSLVADSNVVSYPPFLTIPAGETEVSFNIGTILVATDKTVNFVAQRGTQSATAQLIVLSPDIASLTLTPNTVRPNQYSTAFLTLDQIAPPGGIKVNISASLPSLVTLPSQITIPGGRSTGSFSVRARAVSRTIAVEIICQIPGKARRVSAFLFINP